MRLSIAVLVLALLEGVAHGKPFGKKKNLDAEKMPLVVEDDTVVPEGDAAVASDEEELEKLADQLRRSDEAPFDLAAEDPPDEGIWAWVQRMEDEVPSEAQIEAIREKDEESSAERAVLDELVPERIPDSVYTDGAAPKDPLMLDRVDPSEFDIPMVVTPEVRKWVDWFTGPVGRKYYARWMARSTKYRPMMYRELEAKGLPKDLVYLSMVESGYNAHAYSHADAAGLWQFIPSTARLYDLRVDWWVDDRRDPGHSTRAGTELLAELHQMFGDWYLAWASYNGGPGRVRRASANAGTKDFWVLARGGHLPSETANYVPKILAAAIIGHHPDWYGFTDIAFEDELVYETQHVEGSVDLSVLARCADLSVDEFQGLNPGLRRWSTPPEGYDVRVPVTRKDGFAQALAKVPKSERLTITKHKVARGETLSVIAKKYGVDVDDVVKANRLKNANQIYVGTSLVIPLRPTAVAQKSEPPAATASAPKPAPKPLPQEKPAPKPTAATSTYVVRAGDTLSGIASRHGATVSQVRAWNQLKTDTIYVGQELRLQAGEAAVTTYSVRDGDTLSGVASRFGVAVSDLTAWNSLQDASTIYVGQKLTVKRPATSWKTYTVKAGDSLGKIAAQNGCSVADIQRWNNLSGTVIRPGQELKLKS